MTEKQPTFLMKCLKNNEDLYKTRQNLASDSGLDLFFTEDIKVPSQARSFKIGLGVALEKTGEKHGYYLYPRSSIVKTPLMLCNSVGIIDFGYRNEIMAFVHNLSDKEFELKRGTSLFQVCLPSLSPISFEIVDELSVTDRKGGFGSTDKK